ncbi:hypothetical protein J2Y45_001579 [Dyadobacter sp. BE34]|uniref:Uncharacterized protein n=1 Tax=Dyadobacter fermentans TaxID=94254 RepID=A0ABU1QVI1_9BACT|nr:MULTISPECIES: hypothetical protein [Dyadobacter]MDR6804310.1 hypothetical protein [Dyadobacter fermentans]MDR7042050.1 hypothetical protein [Dyadobacter sp. BE242]MDR7196453.1 hypothetical protein [Dyadobacter sp. BE34]MDR7213002.1 hypothetical protein [Dyadobacter sp. BE31]MDR7261859.1 hypothetical protein [Dyadobacter sp. BE32]
MNTPWYDYFSDGFCKIFYFAGSGNGRIDKIVIFTQMQEPDAYSITLGNLRLDGSIDVHGTAGDGDAAEILSTVAKVIAFFLVDHPQAAIFIEGTTAARVRLYQMAIVRELDDLGKYFDIHGFDGSDMEIFQPGRNYLSFTISLKS